MSRRLTVIIRPNAEADLREAWLWYEFRRPGLGDDFLAEVHAVFQRLEINPESPAYYYRDFRRLLTRRFPYKVFYRVKENRVIVFRILHAKREHRRQLYEVPGNRSYPMDILYAENHAAFAETVKQKFLAHYSVTIVPSLSFAREKLNKIHTIFCLWIMIWRW